jgi:hypothetical protein
MNPQDRKRLEELQFSPEVIWKTEEVLRIWGVTELFVLCSWCGNPCINPEIRNRKYRRRKPPSELFWKLALGFRDDDGTIICRPCDDARFQ